MARFKESGTGLHGPFLALSQPLGINRWTTTAASTVAFRWVATNTYTVWDHQVAYDDLTFTLTPYVPPPAGTLIMVE